MKIQLRQIKINDLVSNYKNDDEEGVFGYGGILNIRPPYQREFKYNDKQQIAVLNSIKKGFPINVMYWAVNEDQTLEVLDGQQRILSICEYIEGNFAINYQYFHNLTTEEQKQILDYELMVYFCEGTDKEKLEWFKTINIAGVKLTDQELRNAIYTGPWLTDAKKYFSKTSCPAYQIAKDYMAGSPINQDYLETTLSWINNGDIETYMAQHQSVSNAGQLWTYFQSVISWVKITFPTYRKQMKGVQWGELYNKYHTKQLNPIDLENEIKKLIDDDDVQSLSGIYYYVLSRQDKHLNLRAFDDKTKQKVFQKQKGICVHCKGLFEFSQMEGDHITPWHLGGKTTIENCQMLCKDCNRKKSGK